MSAPSTVYNTEILEFKLDETTKFSNRLALKLSEYGSNIKTLFYLDLLLIPDKGDTNGFIGAVILGGENANMHATARYGKGRLAYNGSSPVYIILNDGGLNTAGKPTINNNTTQFSNLIRNNYTFLSAYYVDTDFTGVRYRVGSGAWTEISFLTTIPQQQSLTVTKDFASTGTKGDLLEMQAVIKNAEKPMYSASTVIALKSAILNYMAFKRTTACATSGQESVTIWITDDVIDLLNTVTETPSATGLYLYTDVEQTTLVGAGWYYGLYDTRSFYVGSDGQISYYMNCTPTMGTIYLSLEDNGEGLYNRVSAFVDPIYPIDNIVITGRVDTDPSFSTPNGENFSVTILAGQIIGYDSMNLPTGVTYYWQGATATPSGFTLVLNPI